MLCFSFIAILIVNQILNAERVTTRFKYLDHKTSECGEGVCKQSCTRVENPGGRRV